MSTHPTASLGKKVLVVDDEPQIVEIVERYLMDEGFNVCRAFDGSQAVALEESEKPDLVVLDLNLPLLSGMDVLRTIRQRSHVPVIMLTSRKGEVDSVLGLELGADDYITKPFSPREVVARVKAVLRRAGHDAKADIVSEPEAQSETQGLVRVGELEIDSEGHEVRIDGTNISLTPTEFRILEVLAKNPGHTFTRAKLLDLVRGENLEMFDRTLDRHVANLRHKIESDPASPRYIVTVFGVGYKMPRKP